MEDHELDSMIVVCHFQLRIFHNSMISFSDNLSQEARYSLNFSQNLLKVKSKALTKHKAADFTSKVCSRSCYNNVTLV